MSNQEGKEKDWDSWDEEEEDTSSEQKQQESKTEDIRSKVKERLSSIKKKSEVQAQSSSDESEEEEDVRMTLDNYLKDLDDEESSDEELDFGGASSSNTTTSTLKKLRGRKNRSKDSDDDDDDDDKIVSEEVDEKDLRRTRRKNAASFRRSAPSSSRSHISDKNKAFIEKVHAGSVPSVVTSKGNKKKDGLDDLFDNVESSTTPTSVRSDGGGGGWASPSRRRTSSSLASSKQQNDDEEEDEEDDVISDDDIEDEDEIDDIISDEEDISTKTSSSESPKRSGRRRGMKPKDMYSPKEDDIDREIRRESQNRKKILQHDDDDTKIVKKKKSPKKVRKEKTKKMKEKKKKKSKKRQESKHVDDSESSEDEAPTKEISFHECLVRSRNADKNFVAVKEFATTPVRPEMGNVMCYINRSKESGTTLYQVMLEGSKEYLFTGKRRKNKATPNYIISMHNGDLSKESPGFVGKLRGNTRRNKFTIYDSGHSPKEMRFVSTSQAKKHLRKELGAVIYSKNVSISLKPRVMTIGIPTLNEEGVPRVICPTSEGAENQALEMVDAKDRRLQYLENKEPRYDKYTKTYILDFKGRVTIPSVKNFQLVLENNVGLFGGDRSVERKTILQFGKIGADKFTMDFRHPLSPVQAFGIVLSAFEA